MTSVIVVNYSESNYVAVFSGPFNQDQKVLVFAKKINNVVILEVSGVNVTSLPNTKAKNASSNIFLDMAYRPKDSIFQPVPMIMSGGLTKTLGKLEINASGAMKVWADLTTTELFTGTFTCGWQRFSTCYTVA